MDSKRKRALLSWSSGKDSAWALHMLQKKRLNMEVVGLFTTIHEDYQRVTLHAVRLDLVRRQAGAAGLPLQVIEIPDACSDERYQEIMSKFVAEALDDQIQCMVFGDLFLEDVRDYREERLKDTGITPIFPLWEEQTGQLAREMLSGGLRAIVTCVDLRHLPGSFAGREYNLSMLADLPATVDPCGENGEFHTCVVDGPMFDYALEVSVGDIVERDGFMFADLVMGEISG